ncbi:DUF6894 family protein [Microvirga lenta]|uniref:DUF6894 family protein n=1 Tax=Microvirga lenta TaxID=2881337 RepID=UPI00384EBD39
MPRYYCHIRQGKQLIQDPEGVDLPDLDAAQVQAIQGIRDVLAEGVRRGDGDGLDDVLVITDEAVQELLTIPFIEALPPRFRQP